MATCFKLLTILIYQDKFHGQQTGTIYLNFYDYDLVCHRRKCDVAQFDDVVIISKITRA